MSTIVCFGEALIDFLAAPEGGQGRVFRQFAGGAPANAAVAIARLGGACEFVGMLGRDMFGDFLLDSLHEAAVGTQFVRRTDRANTALAFVSLDARGERSFSFYRPPAADLLFAQGDFDDACFRDLGIFHVCSNSMTDARIADTTFAGMQRAHATGALISMDINLRPALWPEGKPVIERLWRALALADMVKLAREELEFLQQGTASADAVIARLLGDARLVLVTDGGEPLHWHTRSGFGAIVPPQVTTIDTTAAGDAFIGGLLCQLQKAGIRAQQFDAFIADEAMLAQALDYAAACGAFAVTRHGAFAALPTHVEVLALLATL